MNHIRKLQYGAIFRVTISIRQTEEKHNMKVSLILMSAVLISIAQSKVTSASSDSSVQTNQSESETVIKQPRRDYKDEAQHNKKAKNIRSAENWIALTCLALTIIALLILFIIVIHLKSRQKSDLLYLYA